MIVVDASALIAFFLREEGWRDLAKYMVRTMSVDHVIKEFYNAVWKAVYMQKRIDVTRAREIIDMFKKYLSKNMEIRNEINYIDYAYQISLSNGLTIYDSLYIAQAIKENLPLLTLDQKQKIIAHRLGISILP